MFEVIGCIDNVPDVLLGQYGGQLFIFFIDLVWFNNSTAPTSSFSFQKGFIMLLNLHTFFSLNLDMVNLLFGRYQSLDKSLILKSDLWDEFLRFCQEEKLPGLSDSPLGQALRKTQEAAIDKAPLALVGGIAALWISGQNLSVPASVGFIALFGIALFHLAEDVFELRRLLLRQFGVARLGLAELGYFARLAFVLYGKEIVACTWRLR